MTKNTEKYARSIPGIDPEELALLTEEEIAELENLEQELAPIMHELDNPVRTAEELAFEERVLRRIQEQLEADSHSYVVPTAKEVPATSTAANSEPRSRGTSEWSDRAVVVLVCTVWIIIVSIGAVVITQFLQLSPLISAAGAAAFATIATITTISTWRWSLLSLSLLMSSARIFQKREHQIRSEPLASVARNTSKGMKHPVPSSSRLGPSHRYVYRKHGYHRRSADMAQEMICLKQPVPLQLRLILAFRLQRRALRLVLRGTRPNDEMLYSLFTPDVLACMLMTEMRGPDLH